MIIVMIVQPDAG